MSESEKYGKTSDATEPQSANDSVAEFMNTDKFRVRLLIVCSITLLWLVIQFVADNQLIYFYRDSCPYCVKFNPTWRKLVVRSLFDWRFNTISYDVTTEEGYEKYRAFGGSTVPGLVRTSPNAPAELWQSSKRPYDSIVAFAQGSIPGDYLAKSSV